jgi:hypothetical protein
VQPLLSATRSGRRACGWHWDFHRAQFGKVRSGDIAVFTRDTHVIAAGVIGLKFTSPALGRTLWGEDRKGRVWELMYTLDDITPLEMTYAELNELTGDSPNNVHQAFRLMDADKSARALAALRINEVITAETRTHSRRQARPGGLLRRPPRVPAVDLAQGRRRRRRPAQPHPLAETRRSRLRPPFLGEDVGGGQ